MLSSYQFVSCFSLPAIPLLFCDSDFWDGVLVTNFRIINRSFFRFSTTQSETHAARMTNADNHLPLPALSFLPCETGRKVCERDDPADGPLGVIELIHEAEMQLQANVNLKQVLENLVVQGAQRCTAAVGARAAR